MMTSSARDHAEVAVARFAGMHEEGGRAGRGEGRGDLAPDVAGLAHAGDDQAALGVADQFDGGGEGRPKRALQRGRERGDAAALGLERAQRGLRWQRSRGRYRMFLPSAVSFRPCCGSRK